MWYNLILILHIIVCIELIIVVLLQVGKTNALSGIFGGSSQSVFGTQTGNILTKITTFSAIAFMITSVLLTVIPSGKSIIKSSPAMNVNEPAATAPATQELQQAIEQQAQQAAQQTEQQTQENAVENNEIK